MGAGVHIGGSYQTSFILMSINNVGAKVCAVELTEKNVVLGTIEILLSHVSKAVEGQRKISYINEGIYRSVLIV